MAEEKSGFANIRIVLGSDYSARRLEIDGHRVEHIASAVRITFDAGDVLPRLSVDFIAESVEIDGEADIVARLLRTHVAPGVLDVTPISSQTKRWARPRSFWQAHLFEARMAFCSGR